MQSSINTVFYTGETIARMNTACIGGVDRKSTHKAQLPNFQKSSESSRHHRKKHHSKTMEALKAVEIKVT